MTCSRPRAFRTEVSILLKCSTALINKHPAGICPPWELALQMRMLASSAFLETQAVVSSLPHFSQTSARRLSLVCQLSNPHRTSTRTNRVHQYTSSLTSNNETTPRHCLLPPSHEAAFLRHLRCPPSSLLDPLTVLLLQSPAACTQSLQPRVLVL